MQFRICCKAVTGNEPPLTKNALKIHNFKSNYQNSKFKIIITLKKGALRLFPDVLLYLNIIGVDTYVCIYLLAHCCFLMEHSSELDLVVKVSDSS